MSAIQNVSQGQSVTNILPNIAVRAFAVLPESKTVIAAQSDEELIFIDANGNTHAKVHNSLDDEDEWPISLNVMKALSQNTLLAANYNSVRQYDIKADTVVETQVWDLKSNISMASCVSLATDKTGTVKTAVACDYLHLLHDDGSALSIQDSHNNFWQTAVSPDGVIVATGRENGLVELRNAQDLSVQRTLSELTACVLALAFSPNGRYLAAADDYAKLIVWDLETGESVALPGWSKIIALEWFSDSSGFAAVSLSRMIYLYNVTQLQQEPAIVELSEYSPNYIQHAILRDDQTLFIYVEKNGIVQIRFNYPTSAPQK